MSRRPVITIAGLSCETSAFSPSRTVASAFHPKCGHEILEQYDFLKPGASELGDAADWQGALTGYALPGGILTRDAFEELAGELLRRLEGIVRSTGGLQGLWYDIHGAMCVEGLDDCEAELLRRIRKVVGKDVVVSASMDLHGNVSRELAHQTDLVTCFRTAPHVDVTETNKRACRNLVNVLARHADGRPGLPYKAWIPIPILLAGEQTSTRVEPAKHLYAAVPEIESTEGVMDASIWVGYAWADEPRNRAAVVVTGWDKAAVAQGAEKLARIFWDAHEDFAFVAPVGSLDECLAAALSSSARPYFISDSGDNPTAGGSGDVTWTLHRLLERREFKQDHGPKLVYASIPAGAEAIRVIEKAGIDSMVTVTVGAAVDDNHAGPAILTGRVHAIKHSDPHARTEAILQVGSMYIVLTELRKPYHHEHDFTDLDLDIRGGAADIVVVKIGYLEPELFDLAADWMMALTPGGVDQRIESLGHKRIQRPMWPFDKDWATPPDLGARMIPPSYEKLPERAEP